MNTFCLIAACVCFGIGSFSQLAPGQINWTNAGLFFVTLSMVL